MMDGEIPISADATLDCAGTYCPEPIIRTADQVKMMQEGQILEIIGSDPGIQIDIPAWCTSHGHQFLGLEMRGGLTFCYLRIG